MALDAAGISGAGETYRLPRGISIGRGRLAGADLASHPPVSVACFDSLGVYAGRGRPVPGSGERLLPASLVPLLVEVRRGDGSRQHQLAPPAP